jgi:uncharacterized protein involved in type VI secretion and phage assembly
MAVAELSFASGDTSLSVRTFRVEEAVSKPFSITVMARSPNQIDLESIVGQQATLTIQSGVVHLSNATRTWTGICHLIEQVQAEPTGLSTYEIGIMPALWLLNPVAPTRSSGSPRAAGGWEAPRPPRRRGRPAASPRGSTRPGPSRRS